MIEKLVVGTVFLICVLGACLGSYFQKVRHRSSYCEKVRRAEYVGGGHPGCYSVDAETGRIVIHQLPSWMP